ncbi:MAG: sugar kinase [Agarilytica sp.]
MFELSGASLKDMTCAYGGDCLNTALYFNRLTGGCNCYFVTAIGRDPLSKIMLSQWQAENLNCSCVLVDELRHSGIYSVSVDTSGERNFHYWRKESAATNLLKHPGFSEVCKALNTMDVVYVSGISLAILSNADRQRLLEILSLLHDQGVRLIVDSNYRPALWENVETARHCMKPLLALAEVALVTFQDEVQLWGDRSVEECNQRIRSLGVRTVVIKSGQHGVYSGEGNNEMDLIEAPTVDRVVDTTAAGDSFNAGFLAKYFANQNVAEACRYGSSVAAQVIGHQGAIVPAKEFVIPEI